jgi:hypothetical protein
VNAHGRKAACARLVKIAEQLEIAYARSQATAANYSVEPDAQRAYLIGCLRAQIEICARDIRSSVRWDC